MPEIPWKDIKTDPPPNRYVRIVAIDANPIIGTGIICSPAPFVLREPYVTCWCYEHEIPIPAGVKPVNR